MKQHFILAGFLLLAPLPALAQVTVNPAALQQLAGIVPPPMPAVEAAPVAAAVHHWRHMARVPVAAPKPAAPVQQVAAHVPPPAQKPAAPKPLAPISLVFAPGSADLPANATTALKPFCAAPGKVAVDARAPIDPSDPSGAMRLSLARAMAVQQALSACGVAGINILPRALGAVPGQNEDVAVVGGNIQ